MRRHGGLLTSFNPEVKPDKYTFVLRNELVAGLCDALIVVETGIVGGSHLTIEAALKIKKKIFAVPGRLSDEKSKGCLRLIREGKADLLMSAKQLQADLGWHRLAEHPVAQSALPFPTTTSPGDHQISSADRPDTTPDHQTSPSDRHIPSSHDHASQKTQSILLRLLTEKDSLSIDELATVSHLDAPSLAVTLLHLELAGKVRPLPGKRYRLNR
jgi:DNA processing protein